MSQLSPEKQSLLDWKRFYQVPLRDPGATNPFHVKGGPYNQGIGWASAHIPGGRDALLAALPTAELRKFLSQNFMASQWYDMRPIPYVDLICASLSGMTLQQSLERSAIDIATSDVNGAYKILFKLISPGLVARRLPALTTQIFDFSTVSVLPVKEPNVSRCVQRGMPQMLGGWVYLSNCRYVEVAMRASGAKTASMEVIDVQRDGFCEDYQLIAITYEIKWT